MAHKMMIGGSIHEISSGKMMINGTVHDIAKGKAMIDGTVMEIPFGGLTVGKLPVGSSVYANVNGTKKEFIVVHQGLPSSLYDDSCDGTWLWQAVSQRDNFFNSGSSTVDYKSSKICTYLNDTYLPLLDANVQSAIKTVKIPYINGNGETGTVGSGANGLSTRVFLLSVYELGFTAASHSAVPAKEGERLSYFASNTPSRAKQFLTRSPSKDNPSFVLSVTTANKVNPAAVASSYLATHPAFILPANTAIDESNNILA